MKVVPKTQPTKLRRIAIKTGQNQVSLSPVPIRFVFHDFNINVPQKVNRTVYYPFGVDTTPVPQKSHLPYAGSVFPIIEDFPPKPMTQQEMEGIKAFMNFLAVVRS